MYVWIFTGHADVEAEQLYNQTVHYTLNISENQRMTINWLLFLGNKTTICKQQWNMKKLKRNKDIDKTQQQTAVKVRSFWFVYRQLKQSV